MTSAPQDIPGASSTTNTRNRASTFSYPRWDANGNSHHPPPDVGLSRTLSRSQAASSSASTSTSPPSGSSSTTPSSSSILRLLGLSSPPPASSSSSAKAPPLHPSNTGRDEGGPGSGAAGAAVGVGDSGGQTRGRAQQNALGYGHRRGVSYGGSSNSASAAAIYSSSPFYEDDEDGPPEAITPPQLAHHQLPMSSVNNDSTTTTASVIPTNYGHELDAAHKLELDDVFDGDSSITLSTTTGKTGNNNKAMTASSAPLGRRSSWSPAAKHGSGANEVQYSSSPPAGIMSWLNGQSSTYPISVQAHNNSASSAAPTSPPPSSTDYGSSPVGLFRRLSLSVNRRPPPPAPASTISEVSDINDRERIGRPLTKVTSAPPRRLSPMGERMLRAHYDSFS